MIPFPDQALLVPRTIFGRGKIAMLPKLCRPFGNRGLLAHGASLRQSGRLDVLRRSFGADVIFWEHKGAEPTLDQADALREAAHACNADWLAAVGGGSVLDLAKTAAGLFNESDPTHAFHAGKAPSQAGIPFIAVPTTAGTGAETTPNAVLTDAASKLKKSIRDDRFMAQVVILDGELLSGSPPSVIAYAGMDALTQAIEAAVSIKANVWSDSAALAAIRLIVPSLPCVFRNSNAPEADALMAGSHLAGIALAHARLGVVHGIAHPLGAIYHQPHGLVCAVCLPLTIALNREAMGEKYADLSEAAGGDLMEIVQSLLKSMNVQNPFQGKPLLNKEAIVQQTLVSGSTLANPKKITAEDVQFLLDRLFG